MTVNGMKLVFVLLLTSLLTACGGADKKVVSSQDAPKGGTLGRIDEGTRCDKKDGREALIDLNQDDVPDVRKVYKTVGETEVLVCREADMNFDGVKDIFVFFDDQGVIIRDEVDLDYDKQIDIISTYAKGKVIKQEMDTNSDGIVDRVRHLKDGQPFRVEGDMNGDGRIDLWEYYEDGKLVRLGTDDDGDGRADSWSRDADSKSAGQEEAEQGDTEASEEANEPAEASAEPPPAEASTPDTPAPQKEKTEASDK